MELDLKRPHPREVLRGLEQRARKRFGQNFLVDDGITGRIVRGAQVGKGDKVLEIGPGLCALTDRLIEAGADVTAVELDRDLVAYIRTTHPDLRLIEGDAAKIDWAEVVGGTRHKVVANLPFNVGTTLLIQLSKRPDLFSSVTVMLQKEVVDRIIAPPGSRTYGALTVQIGARGKATQLITVPREAFHPPPKITASVVRVDLYDVPMVDGLDVKFFDRVVKVAFSQRRKTIANSLAANFGKEVALRALNDAGIDSGLRAERLSLEDFVRLAKSLDKAA